MFLVISQILYSLQKSFHVQINYLLKVLFLKLGFSQTMQSGTYPSNFDVRYTAQKTQSYNLVLKLNLLIYICVSFC